MFLPRHLTTWGISMHRKIIFFLLLLLTSTAPVLADWPDSCYVPAVRDSTYRVLVHPGMKTYFLHLVAGEFCFKLFVLRGNDFDTVQVINDFAEGLRRKDNEFAKELEVVDVNFDGYADLKIYSGESANGMNTGYRFYVFQPDSGSFRFDEHLTEVLGCNPIIDTKEKIITTGGSNGCVGMCYSNDTYKFIRGKLTLIEEEKQEWTDDNSGRYVRTLEKLQNGIMKVVKKVTGTLEEIDRQWNKK